jgi:hypothetical protein
MYHLRSFGLHFDTDCSKDFWNAAVYRQLPRDLGQLGQTRGVCACLERQVIESRHSLKRLLTAD